jgi:16S rRNA (cytosine1402-N4)-methyltransferase
MRRQFANAITTTIKKGNPINTTTQLKNIITTTLTALPKRPSNDEIKKTCQRCFQALRIEINDEFTVLDKFLSRLPDVLKPGGRVAILSFHSGEDRRIKKTFQAFYRDGIFAEIALEPIRPSAHECNSNPRAKSAKLRWGVMG